jgi:hypothetical protein
LICCVFKRTLTQGVIHNGFTIGGQSLNNASVAAAVIDAIRHDFV